MTRRIRFAPRLVCGGLAGCALALAVAATASDVPFGPPATVAAPLGPRTIVLADVDGDGDQDIVGGGPNILWYENAAGNGSLWVPRTISTTAQMPRSVFAADVDGDGDMDVLSASSIDNKIAWYENTAGNGSAWTTRTITGTASGARAVAAADLDGDGDLDVIAGIESVDTVAWYENTAGNGTAWTLHTINTGANEVHSVASADVDADGDLDVVSASFGDSRIAWYENTAGNGSAWVARTISNLANGAFSALPADIDGDGDVDVLAASEYDGTVSWHENVAGNGTVWTERFVSMTLSSGVSAVTADFDGDGDLDVVSADMFGQTIRWHENTAGDGATWTTRTINTTTLGPYAVAVADVDGDGDPDVVGAFLDDGQAIAWHRNLTIHESACFAPPGPISVPGLAFGVVASDGDGDGDPDAFATRGGRVFYYENVAGDGSTWLERTLEPLASTTRLIEAADVDGDGDQDAIAGGYDLGIRWYKNLAGDGSSWGIVTLNSFDVLSLDVGDLDGDGDPDLVAGPGLFGSAEYWRENVAGNGSVWGFHTIATVDAHGPYSIRMADVDGDGDPDVVLPIPYSARILWFENLSGAGTSWSTHTVTTQFIARAVNAADVDGDGDTDLLGLGTSLVWYENLAGNGTVWTQHAVDPGGLPPNFGQVAAFDLDSDGDLDVMRAGGVDGVSWIENRGNGTIWAPHTLPGSAYGTGIAAADVDGDGDPDLMAAGVSGVQWFESHAGQFFLTAADTAPAGAVNGELVPMLAVVATHAGRAGDGPMELARMGLLFEEAPGDPLTSAEANAIIESLRVYRDANGNGVFDPAVDVLVVTVPTLALTSGIQAVSFTDGDPNLQVTFGTPRTYFVVTELTANAGSQNPNQFRVTHLGLGPSASAAEDRTYDIPLRPACPADVSSSVIGPITPVELLGFTVE